MGDSSGLRLYVFGSSLTSAYWNGAATYYRGIYKYLHALGYEITFAEPDIYERQQHRDLAEDPPYAHCPVYQNRQELDACLRAAGEADLIIKHSGIGADDDYLETAVLEAAAAAPAGARPRVAYWDVDAPATLAALEKGTAEGARALRQLLPEYDFIFTYGGGPPVVRRYCALGARGCFPIYNGLDPETHYPVHAREEWAADVSFLGHRLPDREARVRYFFFGAAEQNARQQFLLAGEGWKVEPGVVPRNVSVCGFVPSSEHNALNASARFVLNLNRESMAETGFSPPTRIFEAAGAGAAIISDTWPGISLFFQPGSEILLASGPEDISEHLRQISPGEAARIGRQARERALAEHTYRRRALRVHKVLHGAGTRPQPAAAEA